MAGKKHRRINIIKLLLVVIILAILLTVARKIVINISYPEKYKYYVEKYAEEYKIEKELIYAIIKAESNFREKIVSPKDAIGLMQLLESTANDVSKGMNLEITKETLLNPEININLGTKYISSLIEKYENVELALAAYNAGRGNVDKWIEEGIIKADGTDVEKIPYKETNNYIRKVIRNYKIYKKEII